MQPYTRPIGIRSQTLTQLPGLSSRVHDGVQFETATGTTFSVHAKDLGFALLSEAARWSWTVDLIPSSRFRVERLSPHTLRLHLDIANHRKQALDAIEQLCHTEEAHR
ncbi:hypothetical protein GCM10025780_17620 [Frondihabitans cladoniiphilus]|uniref:Uncharacterized protein n=1 Tax=Frondihabitans cladoniiphilus TaxID=715785 RepID=A0ABP8VVE3_9MICO